MGLHIHVPLFYGSVWYSALHQNTPKLWDLIIRGFNDREREIESGYKDRKEIIMSLQKKHQGETYMKN